MNTPQDTALRRFERSMVIDHEKWHDGIGYDLGALRDATPEERAAIEALLLARGASDWRDVEALAALDTPRAREILAAALEGGSPAIRLAVMRHAPDVAQNLAPDESRVRTLVAALEGAEFYGGLTEALDAVETFHPPPVVDALFRGALARDGATAVHFAAMLTFLHGRASEPFDWEQRPFFLRFHTEDRGERETAFRDLCERIGADPGPYLLG